MPQIDVTDAEVVELVKGGDLSGSYASLKVIGDNVFVGMTEDETNEGDGFMLDQADGVVTLPLDSGEVLYGICPAAGTAVVHVIQTG
jgi:hypothetical protein